MTFSLIKTAPADHLRMGALLRRALDDYGVAHRVCGSGVEYGYLATTHSGPAVYIIAHDENGHPHYDGPRAGCLGATAVVTTAALTRMIYDGLSQDVHPVDDAEACARAVADYLGLLPVCGSCGDYGTVDLHHPSTDAVIGTMPCPDPACQQRADRRADRAAQHRTPRRLTDQEECDPVVCTRCAWGGYTPAPTAPGQQDRQGYVCTAEDCGHTADAASFTLLPGQRLTVLDGRLYAARALPSNWPPF